MLVLTRKIEEEIVLGGNIRVRVISLRGNTVRIGIEAPQDVRILRGELASDLSAQRCPRDFVGSGTTERDASQLRICELDFELSAMLLKYKQLLRTTGTVMVPWVVSFCLCGKTEVCRLRLLIESNELLVGIIRTAVERPVSAAVGHDD